MAQFPSREVAQLSYDYRTLGLGYANLGSLMMVAGIPYNSEDSFAMTAAITAIMTGTSYATSAELASILGPFREYEKNREHMLRVIRNHRYAAYNSPDFEKLSVKPIPIDPRFCPDYLLKSATESWDEALQLGEKYGFRNAQTTVLAPTGTIGLLMDCDTTGVEPDFSLVKFKKLAGGGYFKIINQAIPVALKKLKYSDKEIEAIINYTIGTGNFVNAPYINYESLAQHGLKLQEIKNVEAALKSSFDIEFAFSYHILGIECMERLAIPVEKYSSDTFSLVREFGFSKKEIEEANKYICGTMTVEGAPFLREDHLAVFDTANKNGKYGMRYILPMGHLKVMAAAQSFISGAISKTVNFNGEATPAEIMEAYEKSWEMGLKAIAIYRDGSKMSQPLSSSSDSDAKEDSKESVFKPNLQDHLDELTQEQVLQAAQKLITESTDTKFKRELSRIVERKKLPSKREGFTQKAKIAGQTIFVRTGEYGDTTLGEVFIDMHKEGASFRSMLNSFAIAVSIGLQYGVPLEEFVEKFTFTRFEPSGSVQEHPNIKYATSIIDYVFRMLALEYLNRTDLVQIKPEEIESLKNLKEINSFQTETSESFDSQPVNVTQAKSVLKAEYGKMDQTQDHLKKMMGDAPSCDVCGHITVRNGTCYKCLNCGNSLGCS